MASTDLTGPWEDLDGHEQVVVAYDSAIGRQTVIVVHSTVLSPGGALSPGFYVHLRGRVIQVAEKLTGCDLAQARAKVMRVFTTTEQVLTRAQREGRTPVASAEDQAEDRIAGRS